VMLIVQPRYAPQLLIPASLHVGRGLTIVLGLSEGVNAASTPSRRLHECVGGDARLNGDDRLMRLRSGDRLKP